ncbi:thioredoxin-related transmembrane protein 1-like [Zootermopsis nevadensis]|uniref:Thioredoxin-related transmembrane protein 1 n=2 Tax=Zootermopsis nevadensis TaxID=136037 RepID=A0A067R5A5_ZOONE|nr:thioredoxin-related transmembrane protein 1-like [Zootermopsis nevadensis]KDR13281.1 Thioredoxin-related transmembrane protein 1 [Zootermopsis nevadensis]
MFGNVKHIKDYYCKMAVNMWRRPLNLSLFILLIELYFVVGKPNVVQLNEGNWKEILNQEWMVEFYAPWCPACKALQPVWEEFSTWSDDLSIKVGQVDVTTSPGLSGRFLVTALPTIFHVLNGEFRQYRGAREKDAFISFIEEEKWKAIDPISSWKYPASLQMSVVSYFFKLSQILRAVHNKLMEDYGIPTWGSYLIFAVVTIIIGALLGFVLVCMIDLIYPPKPMQVQTTTEANLEKEKGEQESSSKQFSGDDLDDDVIRDDMIDEGGSDIAASQSGSDTEAKGDEENSNVRKRKPRKDD